MKTNIDKKAAEIKKILDEYKKQDFEPESQYIANGDCSDWCCIGFCDICSDVSCDCCTGDI